MNEATAARHSTLFHSSFLLFLMGRKDWMKGRVDGQCGISLLCGLDGMDWFAGYEPEAPLPRRNSIPSIPLIPFHSSCLLVFYEREDQQPAYFIMNGTNQSLPWIDWGMKSTCWWNESINEEELCLWNGRAPRPSGSEIEEMKLTKWAGLNGPIHSIKIKLKI